jgi:uncharacterized tellurite resistance protein B-like protein
MLDALRQLLSQLNQQEYPNERCDSDQLQLSAAALLIQVSGADLHESGEEQAVIYERLSKLFGLDEDETRLLYMEAQRSADTATSLHQFTRCIKSLDYQKRYDFILALWKVAYADGYLNPHEEALIRKISDLVYVNHTDFIQAKLAITG